MSTREIQLDLTSVSPPSAEVLAFIDEARRQQDEFYDAGLGLRYPKYVPSDPMVVYSAIAFLIEHHLQGNIFCEWGCGFAVAAGMAALMGLESYGIENEDEMVERATRLMKTLNLPVSILQIDYLPDGFEEIQEMGGKQLVHPESMAVYGETIYPPEYEGLDPDQVDLFFVYPWPDQEEMMIDLFTTVSSTGAILLMYQGEGEISAYFNT